MGLCSDLFSGSELGPLVQEVPRGVSAYKVALSGEPSNTLDNCYVTFQLTFLTCN